MTNCLALSTGPGQRPDYTAHQGSAECLKIGKNKANTEGGGKTFTHRCAQLTLMFGLREINSKSKSCSKDKADESRAMDKDEETLEATCSYFTVHCGYNQWLYQCKGVTQSDKPTKKKHLNLGLPAASQSVAVVFGLFSCPAHNFHALVSSHCP